MLGRMEREADFVIKGDTAEQESQRHKNKHGAII
jgi:hypothetical protein